MILRLGSFTLSFILANFCGSFVCRLPRTFGIVLCFGFLAMTLLDFETPPVDRI